MHHVFRKALEMTQSGVDGQIAAELERLSVELAACKEDAERLRELIGRLLCLYDTNIHWGKAIDEARDILGQGETH